MSLQKKKDYESTLPASKELVRLVRLYCFIHQIKVHDFLRELLERELQEFKTKIANFKLGKTSLETD